MDSILLGFFAVCYSSNIECRRGQVLFSSLLGLRFPLRYEILILELGTTGTGPVLQCGFKLTRCLPSSLAHWLLSCAGCF